MSIKGFSVSGVTEQYDYNYLDNKPEIHSIPTGGTAGQVLAKRSGADYAVEWADQTGGGGDITVDDVLSNTSENPVQNKVITAALATKADQTGIQQVIEDEVDDWLTAQAPSIGTLSYAAKQALLACFRKVAWIDDQGQTYYNALESELFPDATLESITAVFTQGSATIYDTDSLDTLKQYLTVTATYTDSSTAAVTEYTLTGNLNSATSVITVNYGGKTDNFNVNVTVIQCKLLDGEYYSSNGEYKFTISNGHHLKCEVLTTVSPSAHFAMLNCNSGDISISNSSSINNLASICTIPTGRTVTLKMSNVVNSNAGGTKSVEFITIMRKANSSTSFMATSQTVHATGVDVTTTETTTSSTEIGAVGFGIGGTNYKAGAYCEFDLEISDGTTVYVGGR